jgi:ATP-dependent DNA helicase RecQ
MTPEHAHSALKKYFGYDAFRPMQSDVIAAVYAGRDTVVLMPTGGGKSICYQIPAITMPGLTLVVSPLIALMKDQVEGLRGNGVPAAYINSSLDVAEARALEHEAVDGALKLLYVSPEKLVSPGFQPLLRRLNISLIAIDEAHCISAWGHDFRPEYTQLKFMKTQFPNLPMLALTATADKLTRKDIISQLGLQNPTLFVSSFDRPNISLRVTPGQNRYARILQFLQARRDQSGIIYCLSRRSCEELATRLCKDGFRAAPYHAELAGSRRNHIQDDFIHDRTPIICATVAFGMGVDKSNVRFVIHYNMPKNVESYYQEIGRAGRDGLPAEALLFFSYSDVSVYRKMFDESESTEVQKTLKRSKLDRMYQYAEAPVCRRATVLNYFGENYEGACGNCDVCLHPPNVFDGTITAQKALSALLRCNEKLGMHLLAEVLRGSGRREILEQGFHKIKTYGAGREYAFQDWLFLIAQMLHRGLMDLAYDDHNHLKVTTAGRAVLSGEKRIQLALPNKVAARAVRVQPKQSELEKDGLFRMLSNLRRELSQQKGIPPYLIFSDATLEQMARRKPQSDEELISISGVGERKLQLYGDAFIQKIKEHTDATP